jgi:HAD superfamily hydrolase (TIGR01450 family)
VSQPPRTQPHPAPAGTLEGFIIDLDGTLSVGPKLTRGAPELIAATGGAYVVVSNNSSHGPDGLAAELAACGLPVPPERIVLAGAATVEMLAAERPGARVMLLGSRTLGQLALAAGLRLTDAAPEFVVLARDERFSYASLQRAADAVRSGAALVATNADLVHPGGNGSVVPETGALLAAMLACCGPVPHRVIGKPGPRLFTEALRRLGTAPARTLVIGDNPETDGAGAARLGMPFLQVHDCDVFSAAAWLECNASPLRTA